MPHSLVSEEENHTLELKENYGVHKRKRFVYETINLLTFQAFASLNSQVSVQE